MSEKFTVIFYDEDRETILDRQEAKLGESITYHGKVPQKAPENGISYTFIGWETTGNILSVRENTELFAKYEESSKVNFKNEEDIFKLSELTAEEAKLNDVMLAGKKVTTLEKAVRNLSAQEKKELVSQIKEKGFVEIDKENEIERD